MKLLCPQLQAFLAVVKHKTVHAAAEAIHLSQTAVTQRIRTLETRLETSLFIRSRRGMLLTSEGEALLRYCRTAQELEGEALSSISGTGIEKNVTICMTGPTTIMHARIVPRCMKIMREFPRLLLHFDVNDNENRVKALRRGESQLAIIEPSLFTEEMEHKSLSPQHYVLVASPQWKTRRLPDIIKNEKIIDFDLSDQMAFDYLKYYDLFDLANTERHLVNRTHTLALMIAEELGYGVLPHEFAEPYLADKRLVLLNAGKTYPHLLSLAWFPRHQQPKYFSAIIEACM